MTEANIAVPMYLAWHYVIASILPHTAHLCAVSYTASKEESDGDRPTRRRTSYQTDDWHSSAAPALNRRQVVYNVEPGAPHRTQPQCA